MSQYKPELRARFGVRELAIFGSYARGELKATSFHGKRPGKGDGR